MESPSIPSAEADLLDAEGRRTTPESGASCAPNIDIPKGETAANRSDVEVLFDGLPEPIDLELDLEHRILYWTDRGDPPRGNTVNRAPIDAKPGQSAPQIVVSDLMEGIGIALDVPGNRMFVTDLAGSLYVAKLDGTDKRMLLGAQGNLTGIAYVEILTQPSEKRHDRHQDHSPNRDHRHRRHRRQLGRAVSRQGTAGRRDGPRAERRDSAAEVRRSRLAGARAVGPVAQAHRSRT